MTEVERKITSHLVAGSGINDLTITADDAPGSGGANHAYTIQGFKAGYEYMKTLPGNPSYECEVYPDSHLGILFQNGTITDGKHNGVTVEALLAVCIDRLECFQNGPFRSSENAIALICLNQAMESLHDRTRGRIQRGVEGKQIA